MRSYLEDALFIVENIPTLTENIPTSSTKPSGQKCISSPYPRFPIVYEENLPETNFKLNEFSKICPTFSMSFFFESKINRLVWSFRYFSRLRKTYSFFTHIRSVFSFSSHYRKKGRKWDKKRAKNVRKRFLNRCSPRLMEKMASLSLQSIEHAITNVFYSTLWDGEKKKFIIIKRVFVY